MSFIIAGSVLLVALLAGIALDASSHGRRHAVRPDTPPFNAWRMLDD